MKPTGTLAKMSRPTVQELRAVSQPNAIVGRISAEHWIGRLWTRRVSIHITRVLVGGATTANQITFFMIALGFGAAAGLLVAGVVGALLAVVGIQLYLLADCVDGEIARWKGTTSARGAYLDRVGHYVVEAALLSAYGFHVGQSWTSGWVSIGIATALLAILTKAETDLIPIHLYPDDSEDRYHEIITPKVSVWRRLRALTHPLKIHRWTGAAEASLLMLAAAIAASLGWDDAERALALTLFAVSAVLVVGHAISIWTSKRLDVESA